VRGAWNDQLWCRFTLSGCFLGLGPTIYLVRGSPLASRPEFLRTVRYLLVLSGERRLAFPESTLSGKVNPVLPLLALFGRHVLHHCGQIDPGAPTRSAYYFAFTQQTMNAVEICKPARCGRLFAFSVTFLPVRVQIFLF